MTEQPVKKKLIDANAFIEFLERKTRCAYPNMFPGLLEAIDLAKDFPAVDAVDMVRCKDCAHKATDENVCLHPDNCSGGYVLETSDNAYCSKWEIKSTPENPRCHG